MTAAITPVAPVPASPLQLAPGADPTARSRGSRVVFLDAVRCLAIVLMVFAHLSDQLLAPAVAASEWFHWYSKMRGITAPLFFGVAGWAFSIATMPSWHAFHRWGEPLKRRLRRAALLFAWGYLLTLPWWAEGFPFHAAPEVWRPFWSFGVLQCIATALLVAHLLLWVSPRPHLFLALTLLVALAAVVAAPALQAMAARWPDGVRGLLNGDGVAGGFPLAPHAAHFWLGNALGALWWLRRWSPARLAAFLALLAAVLWMLGTGLRPSSLATLGPDRFWLSSPSVFLTRAAAAMLIIAGFAALFSRVASLPAVFARSAKHALTFYVVHMLALWGFPSFPGLAHLYAASLDTAGVSAITFACLALTALGLWGARPLAFAARAIGSGRASPFRWAASPGSPTPSSNTTAIQAD